MPGKMPTASNPRSVGRPAQGNNRGFREDPQWSPKAQPAPVKVSTGSVSKPKSTGRWAPKPQPAPGRINNVGPGV